MIELFDLFFDTVSKDETLDASYPTWDAGQIRAFVRSRMQKDAFYDTLLPRMFDVLNRQHLGLLTQRILPLRNKTASGKTVYYLDRPCRLDETVEVHPWWGLGSTVTICRKDYRPEELHQSKSGSNFAFCDTVVPRPGSTCRCGKYLLNCAQNEEQVDLLMGEAQAEAIGTMQYVMREHQPFERVLSMKETVRSDYADLFYARSKFYESGVLNLPPQLSEKATLRPRPEEFGGGILSSERYLFFNFGRRVVVAEIWNDFLCSPFQSTDVNTHDLLDAASPTLRSDEHMDLTTKIGCKDCHARLEYGIRAYSAFDAYRGTRFERARQFDGVTKFFLHDSTDLRGAGPATPQWVGETIGKQPEFASCIVRRVEEVVFSGTKVPTNLHARLSSRFAEGHDLANLFEDTVVGYTLGAQSLDGSPHVPAL